MTGEGIIRQLVIVQSSLGLLYRLFSMGHTVNGIGKQLMNR